MDFVTELGALTLDHRFKRMMQRLLDEAEALYRSLDLPIKPRWVSTLLLLEKHGPLAVMDVADRLSVTHPAVIQLAQDLVAAGLVVDARDEADGRRRFLALAPRGVDLMPTLKRVWAELARGQRDAFRAAGCDILAVLDAVEARLDQTPLASTVLKRLGPRKSTAQKPDAKGASSSPRRERTAAR